MPAMQMEPWRHIFVPGRGDSMRHDEIIHRLDQMTAQLAALKA
jgi:hypothetical protein